MYLVFRRSVDADAVTELLRCVHGVVSFSCVIGDC